MSDFCGGTSGKKAVRLGGSFELIDHHGRSVSDCSYREQFMLLFFGFTHCRVVCPGALARLSKVIDRLGPLSSRLQPLYVTIDPDRDTPEVMKAFLEENYPHFIGLSGSRENIEQVKALYKVFVKRTTDPDDATGYQMPHTAFTYLIGPDGRYVAHFTDAIGEDELVDQIIRRLV
ncbi:SCO family protein [Bradyrhizobium cenepequi]|uniref:SCO family protein n=1 Tax=Bradyrhizobium cenepequi TaxID=2821403 RepID=UPI001CE23726|nr:SCO family protein [Bradyrhizobium cenepequi]MCA6107015.1 SCO family protein [Bradyrhizobium cenepequi]